MIAVIAIIDYYRLQNQSFSRGIRRPWTREQSAVFFFLTRDFRYHRIVFEFLFFSLQLSITNISFRNFIPTIGEQNGKKENQLSIRLLPEMMMMITRHGFPRTVPIDNTDCRQTSSTRI